MLEWLIIGGGVHGTHHSLALTHRYKIPADRVRVLDPHDIPLANWHHLTRNVGMAYMRSPHVHNLHWDQGALAVYARIHEHQSFTTFIPPFNRPSLELFNRHSQHLIEKYGLAQMRVRGTASGILKQANGWRVETEQGAIDATRVMLAIGSTQAVEIPDWARDLRSSGAPVHHIFESTFDRTRMPSFNHVAVIGGGISAAQVALSFLPQAHVHLIMRHDIRVHDFDSDTGWMNRIYLSDYAKIQSPEERRRKITQARHQGSMPSDVVRDLNTAIADGHITRMHTHVQSAQVKSDKIDLQLANGQEVTVEAVLLATGFKKQRPGGQWLDTLIQTYDLTVTKDGYPIPNSMLEWDKGLHVSGGLAEIEIGPVARNIVGARMASERLHNNI